jgi:hypothetical protein
LRITDKEFNKMINYFLDKRYCLQSKYNPINMIYHYIVTVNPKSETQNYEFLNSCELQNILSNEKILDVFKEFNKKIGINFKKDSSVPSAGGGSGEQLSKSTFGGSRQKRKSAKKRKSKRRNTRARRTTSRSHSS